MILWFATMAFAVIDLEAPPLAGQEVTITVVDDLSRPVTGATVRALYRRGLADEQDMAVGLTDARGRVYWVPKRSGPVTLRVKDDELITKVDAVGPSASAYALAVPTGVLSVGLFIAGLWGRRRRNG